MCHLCNPEFPPEGYDVSEVNDLTILICYVCRMPSPCAKGCTVLVENPQSNGFISNLKGDK